jgi:TolB-like protein
MAQRFVFGSFLFDTERGSLTRDGQPVAIGHRRALLLRALIEAQGTVVGKERLMAAAWPGLVVEESNLSVQIAALRKALGTMPNGVDWVVTVPRIGYRFVGGSKLLDETTPEGLDAGNGDHQGRPSIAVMPFSGTGGDAIQDYLADGITEDVIAALSRFRWFSVTGRNASFVYKGRAIDPKVVARELGARYLVVGTLRRHGESIRVSAELVDARHGTCLWADRYDFGLAAAFEVQDAIATQVAGAIEPELLKSEGGTALQRQRAGSSTAWDTVARGSWLFHQLTQSTHLRARELFRQASAMDPQLAEAKLWIGRVSAGLVAYGWSEHPETDLREGMDAALQAVQMDPRSPYTHYALAIVGAYSDSFALAIRAAQKSVELSPSFALGHLVLGMSTLFSGEAVKAEEALERGLRLNRNDSQNFVWYTLRSLACLFGRRPEVALRCAVESLKIRPTWRPALDAAAASCAALGNLEEARHWASQAATVPEASGDALQPLWRNNPDWATELRQLLQVPSVQNPALARRMQNMPREQD